jgi:hypothetical protein
MILQEDSNPIINTLVETLLEGCRDPHPMYENQNLTRHICSSLFDFISFSYSRSLSYLFSKILISLDQK